MSKSRIPTWIAFIAVPVGLLIIVVLGLVGYVNTIPPLHPNAESVTSMMESAPSPVWAHAVTKGRQVVRAAIIEGDVPGVSVAVGVDGEIVWAEGFGWADVEKKVTVTPGMRFRIGHTSKALTSAAAGLLREQGRLHFDEEIQTYVPAFPRKPWPVTVRQLMGHMAGVRHYRDTEWGDRPTTHCERAAEGLQSFADNPLLFEPETQYKYSTYGWVLVSAAIEAAAGEPFFTVMRKQVFEPLGMRDTEADSDTQPIPDRVTFYHGAFGGRALAPAGDFSCFAGAGGFLSTPSDLVRFGMALSSGKLLQPGTVRMLQTPQQLKSGKDTEYGLGWMLETETLAGEPTRLVHHANRTVMGGSTAFMTFPERGLFVAVTTNIAFANPRWIAWQIAQAFAEQRKTDDNNRKLKTGN